MAFTEIVYGPHPRVRLIPSAIAICLALAVGTFFVALYDVNGMREQSGYAPPVLFLGFALVFLVVFWLKLQRITLTADGVVVERLFPRAHRVAFAPYNEIKTIRQAKLSLKLELLDERDHVLLVIPETIEHASGKLSAPPEESIPGNAQGILRELYQLRHEIAVRSSAKVI